MHSSFKANFNLYPATNLKSLEVNNPFMSRTKVRAASQCQCQPMAMFGAKRSRVQLHHIASLLKQWSSVLSKNPLQCVHLEVCSVFKAARQLIVYCCRVQSSPTEWRLQYRVMVGWCVGDKWWEKLRLPAGSLAHTAFVNL